MKTSTLILIYCICIFAVVLMIYFTACNIEYNTCYIKKFVKKLEGNDKFLNEFPEVLPTNLFAGVEKYNNFEAPIVTEKTTKKPVVKKVTKKVTSKKK